MPLDFIDSIGENIHLAVWKINESEVSLMEMLCLSDKDRQLLSTIHHQEKRLEFLSGRMLAQEVMSTIGADFKGLFRNDYGKPEIINSPFQISLSHTADFVVALLSDSHNVGIDIEKPQEKMRKIANRLFNVEELSICADDLDLISKVWSAKEVLFKLYMRGGIDFKNNLFVKDFNQEKSQCTGKIDKDGSSHEYTLAFKNYNDYFICYNIN